MNIKTGTGDWKKNITLDLLLTALLFSWAFFVNRKLKLTGLYMDDLYMWSCFREESFTQFVFPAGNSRVRPVYWFLTWLELCFIRNHISWLVPINIILNALVSTGLYFFAKKLSGSRTAAFLSGILYLTSRFSYYQIGQQYGLMETMGLFFAVAMCACLYRYLHSVKDGRSFYAALIFYFLNCFTHERYMVLLPMLFYALIAKKDRRPLRYGITAASFGVMLLVRKLSTGTLSPAGTGGTRVADTITVNGTVHNFLAEIAYVFGFNAGPDYLCGIPFGATPFLYKVMVAAADFILIVFFILFLTHIAERIRYALPIGNMVADIFLFAGFMIGCAAASAVTIRVEMRWVYSVYTFGILLNVYLYGAIFECRVRRESDEKSGSRFRITDFLPLSLLVLFSLIMIPTELFYRTGYPKIYLFQNQKRYNSLADETYGKYGNAVFGKQIIIIGNAYKMSDFTADTFFKTFDGKRNAEGTTVEHADSIKNFGLVTDRMLILKEDTEHDLFTDVTDAIRNVKLGIYYGYYRDGWMDRTAEIDLMTGSEGKAELEMVYPGNLTGTEQVTIWQDGVKHKPVDLKENIQKETVTAPPYQIIHLKFENNFEFPNAEEKRGEEPLSLIVNITAN
jgi:hypothetical protein